MTSFPPLPPDDDYVIDSEEVASKTEKTVTLHPKFFPLTKPMRNKVLKGGRGGMKSHHIAKLLLLKGTQEPLLVACCRETMQSMTD